MDQKTLDAYSAKAFDYRQDWQAQPEPRDVYQLVKQYFHPWKDTADIGCGSGRDANWLSWNGFKVWGYDSSAELLKLASEQYPHIPFEQSFLPVLGEIHRKFDNIFCETVIMHVPTVDILEGLKNLKRVLQKDGVLYLSWRVTEGFDLRHNDGRLYSAFAPSFILDQFSRDSILHFEDRLSESSGKRVCRLIVKGDAD